MTEEATRSSAGALLRAERERQGLHIGALAVTLKISPRKLDLLERDRYDELPGLTFTRALAISVCRELKIDAAPVLAGLPVAQSQLGALDSRLNAPMPSRRARSDPNPGGINLRWSVLVPIALVLAAVALMWMPEEWLRAPSAAGSVASQALPLPAPAAAPQLPGDGAQVAPGSATATATATATAAVEPSAVGTVAAPTAAVALAPNPAVAPAPAPPAPAAVAAVAPSGLHIKVQGSSWVEVTDARGRTLISRLLSSGESVALTGTPPLRATVGNAAGTVLTWQGRVINLSEHARDNVVRLELP